MIRPRLTFLERLARFKSAGSVAGYVACILLCTFHFYASVIAWWQPEETIDIVPDLAWNVE